nr:glycosyltransferase family 2 protein [Clostridium grantii]
MKKILDKTVSVVIPCKNEKNYIQKCLDSFINQSYHKELYEILVCDGMSTDGTREIVKEYTKKHNNIKLLDNIGITAPKAMNIGIKNSNSDIVVIFGAHAEAHFDFIKNNVEKLMKDNVHCSGGPIETVSDSNIGKAISLSTSSPFGVGNALFRYSKEEKFVDTVAFGAYKREVFHKIGYFNEELTRAQDFEFNFRLTQNKLNILLSPDIKSKYYSRSSLKNLWNQYYQYGFWKPKIIKEYKKIASIRHIIPTLFVFYNILSLIGSIFSGIFFYQWLAFMSLYFILDAIVSFKLSKKEINLFPLCCIVFPILHVSYGVGFIVGYIAFSLNFDALIKNNTKITR